MSRQFTKSRELDTGNSTIANLGIGGVYTGTWTASTAFSSVLLQIYTNQASASLGLEIQTRYGLAPTYIHAHKFTIVANSTTGGAHLEAALPGDEYRIVYTNGGTATTTFSMVSTPAKVPSGVHMHPVDYSFNDTHPVQLGRTILTGKNPGGNYVNFQATTAGNFKVSLEEYDENFIQTPLPTNGDSVYAKDINVNGSSIGTFSGDITDLFDDLDTAVISTGHSSPANLTIKLKRPLNNDSIKLCSEAGDNFSNVKIILKDRGGAILQVVDESSNNTKYTSNTYDYPITPWCTVIIEFHTTDDVGVNWALMEKSQDVHAVIRIRRPNGTYVDATGTTAGNSKVSIEEYDDAIDPIRKDMEGGGKISVGTTAVEVTFAGTTKSIHLSSDTGNIGTLYWGKSNVTSVGANAMGFLEAGESITIDYDDTGNPLYIVSDTASQNFFKGALL